MYIISWKFRVKSLEFKNSKANTLNPTQPSYGGYAGGVHLFPYRTEKLSPPWPMVLVHQPGE